MNCVVAADRPTSILWRRASALASPTEVPASTLPTRGMAPVRANIASRSVVFPLWKGPTSAMHRGPRGLLTSCPIAASSFGARPLIGSAHGCSPHIDVLARRKNVAAVHPWRQDYPHAVTATQRQRPSHPDHFDDRIPDRFEPSSHPARGCARR